MRLGTRMEPHFLKHMTGQLFCEACIRNVGSSSSAVQAHISTQLHSTKMREMWGKASWFTSRSETPRTYADYKGAVSAKSGGQHPAGLAVVPENVLVIRAE